MSGHATHGHTSNGTTTREFNSWLAMRQRCLYAKSEKYPRYGGRGIKVCDRWVDSFETFLADMGPRPANTTLDRRDNNGNYEPSNCRWATPKEQAANRTRESFDNRSHRTHCRHGHEYSEENTYRRPNGIRRCRTCDRRLEEARKPKRRANKTNASTKEIQAP